MYTERTPLRGEVTGGDFVHSPHRRYNKVRIVNCLTYLFLCTFAAAIMLTLVYYFEQDEIQPFPVNGSLVLSSSSQSELDEADNYGDELTQTELLDAFKSALDDLNLKDQLDRRNPTIQPNTPSYKHQKVLKSDKAACLYSRKGYLINKATTYLLTKHPKLLLNISDLEVPKWLKLVHCSMKDDMKCELPYRTVDGSCNNRKHPRVWGVAMRPFVRVIPPDYCDGVDKPRCAKDKSTLPLAREISLNLHRPEYKNDSTFTYMFAVWGQFIDHDISATALNKGIDGQFLSCCGNVIHPECYPVNISGSDPYYSQYALTCMEFVRSAPAPTCQLGARQQLNQVSSFLDGSAVYGNTENLSNQLRTFKEGKLRMYLSQDGRELLPISTDLTDGCNREDEYKKGRYCFLSGDGRANENLHLTSIHLIMARQHNKLADTLYKNNPHWDDEKVYQESRKILSAQMQHITFAEFLQPLLGNSTMTKYKLNVDDSHNEGYDETVDPSITNNFAAAAFRFAHTLLPKLMKTSNDTSQDLVQLHKMLFNPFQLYNSGGLDSGLLGAMETNTEKLNRFFNTEVTQHLFEGSTNSTGEKRKACGLDLVTLNLQRGRDHGIAGYVKWREYCGYSKIKSFTDIKSTMDQDSVDVLMRNYKFVEDIDLYSGALSERPISDGMLGPTATCLIAEQFHNLKFGDRYWYETDEQPQAFTKEQLAEIKKTTLASIICDNSDTLDSVKPFVMKSTDSVNRVVPCHQIERPNLTYWTSTPTRVDQLDIEDAFEDYIDSKRTSEKIEATQLSLDKPNIIKLYASTTVVAGEAFGSLDGSDPVQLFDGNLPVAINLDTIVDPNLYGATVMVEWEGKVESNNTLKGTFTLPLTIMNGTLPQKKELKGNFSIILNYKWGGSLDIIEANKKYNCKIMFTAYKKLSSKYLNNTNVTLKGKTVKNPESCTIMLAGSFYKRPFYCFIFPWFCTDEQLYYWSGDVELIIRKLAPNSTSEVGNDLFLSTARSNDSDSRIYLPISVVGGSISGSFGDGESINLFGGKFPIKIDAEFLIRYETTIQLSGKIANNEFTVDFTYPINNRHFNGRAELKVLNAISENVLDKNKIYNCKIIFKIPMKAHTSKQENEDLLNQENLCIIKIIGNMNSDKNVYWNGEIELIMKKGVNILNLQTGNDYVSNLFPVSYVNLHAHKLEGKVLSGWVSLSQPAKTTVWNGNYPVDIKLPMFWESNPNVDYLTDNYTHSIIFTSTFFHSTIEGSFKLPKYTKFGLVQWVLGKFHFAIAPLHGGTFYDVIIPGVEYYTKIHFHDYTQTYKEQIIKQYLLSNDNRNYNIQQMNTTIILLGEHNKSDNTFRWEGEFILLINNIPLIHRII